MCNPYININLTIKTTFNYCCVLKEMILYLIVKRYARFNHFPVTSSHFHKNKNKLQVESKQRGEHFWKYLHIL